jgi:hypothetical protein
MLEINEISTSAAQSSFVVKSPQSCVQFHGGRHEMLRPMILHLVDVQKGVVIFVKNGELPMLLLRRN